MVKTISSKSLVKASTTKTSGNNTPEDKTLGINPAIQFYTLEDSNETEEGEEAEILVINNSSLAASKQNLVKRKFPNMDTFDNKGHAVF